MVRLDSAFPGVLLAIASLLNLSAAHPGEEHAHEHSQEELMKRSAHAAVIARDIKKCAGRKNYQKLQREAGLRLAKKAQALREERGISTELPYITGRDLAQLKKNEKVDHNKTSLGFTKKTKARKLFAQYKSVSCTLMAEVTQGPYWITGEYVRKNVAESQDGVPVHLEFQFIDTNTCDAAPDLMIDIWHANSTGVYSGVVSSGNGNYADKSNVNATFLRGAQMTNKHGVAAFDTLVPGHYSGRTNHIHLMAHQDVTEQANKTYTGGTVSHVGQVFFEEGLKSLVEATSPYSTNKQSYTTNDNDSIAQQEASNDFDPLPFYAYLGDDITDGLLMWISVGVDLNAKYTVGAAGYLTANGGVQNSGGGPPGGGPPS